MPAISEILTPERSPAVEAQLVAARKRAGIGPSAREMVIEGAFAGSFLLVAGLIALLADPSSPPLLSAAVLVLAAAAARHVTFSVGSTYTTPTELAFVPMLFVLPVALAPLAVALAFLLAAALSSVRHRRSPARIVNALADCWFTVPPVIVLIAAGEPTASTVAPAVLGAALAVQLAGDFAASALRERLHSAVALREQLLEAAWVYSVDVLLAPLGFLVALGAEERSWVIAFPFAVLAMLSVFSREREQRLDSLVELSEAYRGTALVLGDVIEYDDAYTGLHTHGVVGMATKVAARMRLDPARQRTVEFGALLHDVGKIAVPKEIINKPGPLDEREWEIIKTHTVEGERMLDRIGGLMADVGRVVRSAHERWDGRGYPDGLAGEEIPIESRIIFCCDAFNAMTTDRSYRAGRSAEEALAELRANAGTQFDPAVVDAFAEAWAEGRSEA